MIVWRQHAEYQDPETEEAKWNPAIINDMFCTFVLLRLALVSVFCKKKGSGCNKVYN